MLPIMGRLASVGVLLVATVCLAGCVDERPSAARDLFEREREAVRGDPRFAPLAEEGGTLLLSAGELTARFGRRADLSVDGHPAELAVVAVGRGGDRVAATAGSAIVDDGGVRFDRSAEVFEWWQLLPRGLEHGVTLARAPGGHGDVVVEIEIGSATPFQLSETAVELRNDRGVRIARYADMAAWDADGTALPASMRVVGDRVLLVVNDREATYPIVIDPLITSTDLPLRAPDGATNDYLGSSVAITPDATRAIVGVVHDDTTRAIDAGSARVFFRTGTTWAQEGVLLAPDGASGDLCGTSVAVSADGTRAVVGAPGDDTTGGTDAGSVRVYRRSGTAWAQDAVVLATGGAVGDAFGSSVSLSADGGYLFVGAPLDDVGVTGSNAGTARMFYFSGAAWTQQASFQMSLPRADDHFGASVAVSADGLYAVVGSPFTDPIGTTDAGVARTYARSGTTWTLLTTLQATDRAANDQFGTSVAISVDGARVLIGVPYDDTTAVDGGSARVFLRSGTAWAEEASLVPSDAGTADWFGYSVAFSGDALRALVGAYADDTAVGGTDAGSGRVFVRAGSGWTADVTLLTPDAAPGDALGVSVTLTADGTRALLGANRDNYGTGTIIGSAWSFGLLGPNGSSCSADAACMSGHCADGVCCDTACNNACDACTAALTGLAAGDGTCGPTAAGVTCRAATDACDAGEICGGTSVACPVDGLLPSSTVCRPGTDMCDPAERCTGTTAACPADVVQPSTFVCRAAFAGGCDVAELCTGTAGGSCPTDTVMAPGTVCRTTMGACDPTERCNGISNACPADVISAPGSSCGAAATSCSSGGMCNGVDPECQGGTALPVGTVCAPAAPGNPCDVEDLCDGVSDGCTPRFAPPTTVCGSAPIGGCDVVDVCAGTSPTCVPTYATVSTVCRMSAGSCDVPETCSGSAPLCPSDDYAPMGTLCRDAADVCDVPETCGGTGAACPADARAPATTVCRGQAGPCDEPELCDGTSVACAADRFAAVATVCRGSTDLCDVTEVCDGLGIGCPADAFASGTTCRGAFGDCDTPETCTGTTAACPSDVLMAGGTICRATAGGCDPAELCDGSSGTCPADVRQPAGTACGGGTIGSCSTPGICDGTAAGCPGAARLPRDTVCMPPDPTSECDLPDVCDGTTDVCAARFATETTTCGPTASGDCDAPDHCSGTSGDCVETFLAAVECRPAAGACDLPEVCVGDSTTCPPDLAAASGVVCRASVGGVCDPAEECDGTATSCPTNVTTCDDASSPDVGPIGSDAGPAAATAGCSCRSSGGGSERSALGPGLFLVVLAGSLRRQRLRRRG